MAGMRDPNDDGSMNSGKEPEAANGPKGPVPRKMLMVTPSETEVFLAGLPLGKRAEFLSHHYKQQQLEELVTAESQAFRGCAWTGGLHAAGVSLGVVGSLVTSAGASSNLVWLGVIGMVLSSLGGLLVLLFTIPAIYRFFKWIGRMRARRRLGTVQVLPAK